MSKWTIDDDYDSFVNLDAKVTEVARRWRDAGYARFAIYAEPGVNPKARMEGVEAHLRHIGTPDAVRDRDAVLEAAERELCAELAPRPPTKAERAKRLFERVQQRHGGGLAAPAAEQRPRWVPVQRSAERKPRITYAEDGTLLHDGVRAESRPPLKGR